jgi:CRISPR-associated endonuclease/helicase Cas3
MALPPIWSKHADVVEGRVLAETRAAITGTAVDLPFGELTYGAPDEVLTTRLGVNNWRLVLAHPMSLPFGITVTEIDLPGHMAPKGEPPPERVTPEPTEGGFVFAIGASRYRYTRFGLERDDDA